MDLTITTTETQRRVKARTEAEKAVLGCLLYYLPEPVELDRHVADMRPALFASPLARPVFESIRRIAADGRPSDTTELYVDLILHGGKGRQEPWPEYLCELMNSYIMPRNIGFHAENLRRIVFREELDNALGRAVAGARQAEDGEEAYSTVKAEIARLEALAQRVRPSSGVTASEAAQTAHDEFIRHLEHGRGGLATGIEKLDAMTLGLQPGQMIVLAARPSVGKSALAIQIASHIAAGGGAVLIASLEMPPSWIIERMTATRTGLNLTAIMHGKGLGEREQGRVMDALGEIRDWPLAFVQQTPCSVADVAGEAETMRRRGCPPVLIVIDYLQLVTPPTSGDRQRNRQQEVSAISDAVKMLARQANVPVLALSQLSRALEGMAAKAREPRLSDLRESGSLEQDADGVWLLHRRKTRSKETGWLDHIDLLVAKQRNGPCGRVPLVFHGATQRFDVRVGGREEEERETEVAGAARMPYRED